MNYLKSNLAGLLFLIFFIYSCSGNTKNDSVDSRHPIGTKDSEPVDFAAVGLENLNASHNMKDIVCQTWDFKEDAADAEDADPSSGIELLYRGYCLFSDGSMIKDPRGNMQPGKWIFDDKIKPVVFNFLLDNGETETYRLAYLMPYEMKLVPDHGEKKTVIDLQSEAIRHSDLKKDPFYLSNNNWRFKPAKAESDEEIKARLKSCIQFFILFYEQKINAKSHVVSFIGLPSCFKWYGGGIYLQKENELQPKWVNTFYNREQAMKAYKLADKLMTIKYTWPKKEPNWLKLNISVLKQMEKKIDSL